MSFMNLRAKQRWEKQRNQISTLLSFQGWVNGITDMVCEYLKPWPKGTFLPLSAFDIYPGSVLIKWDVGRYNDRYATVEIDDEPARFEMVARLSSNNTELEITDVHAYSDWLKEYLPHGCKIKEECLDNWQILSLFEPGEQLFMGVELQSLYFENHKNHCQLGFRLEKVSRTSIVCIN